MTNATIKMKAPEILLIGNGNSIYLKNYIHYVLLPRNFHIALFTDKLNNLQRKAFYSQNRVEIIERKRTIPLIRHIPVIRIIEDLLQIKDYLKRRGRIGVVHVHAASRMNTALLPFLKKSCDKTIVTYWGSDLLRRKKRYVRSLKGFLFYADIITFNSEALIEKFNRTFRNVFAGKIYNAKFGTTLFHLIDENQKNESVQEAKRKIGLPQDKTIIVCGHTRAKEHQQLEVLRKIAGMDKKLQQRMCIVFPMTYGKADEEYERELAALSGEMPAALHFYRDYMEEEDVARLRRVSDIFIHAQKSDAFSATLQEFLYAGAVVLNGKWLKYPDLLAGGVKYVEFDDIDDIPEKLEMILSDLDTIKNTMKPNREKIHRLSSWEIVSQRWMELYNCRPAIN
ncbi:MAG: glycosyltransferase [Candidatus Neomarinimicrobiota bacterium]|jgi:glycosyltransferase involved in cell wall biosynthesis|nr:glycosyltransferase [Candidatus Neomarinimicrobiota bacterium]MDX9780378.1 glycosyltransferase [bacterium]